MSEQEERKVALVIVAHHDDAEFGCAGTVAQWVSEGWDVHYVICTDGSGGGPDDATDVGPEARQKIVEARKIEQRAACDVLGVKELMFLGYHDNQFQPTLETRREIVRLLRRYRPTRVICQSPDRSWEPVMSLGAYHPDHLNVGRAVIEAIYPASQNPWDFPELMAEGLKPHKVGEVYIMDAPVVNCPIDISATFETKIASLRAHTSQLGDHFEELEKMFRSWASETGKRHDMAYAEGFHLTKPH